MLGCQVVGMSTEEAIQAWGVALTTFLALVYCTPWRTAIVNHYDIDTPTPSRSGILQRFRFVYPLRVPRHKKVYPEG